MNIKGNVLSILEQNGIYIKQDADVDIDLRDYIADSFQFITFIVELEEQIGIEFPDEFLTIEKLSSLNGFANIIEAVMKEQCLIEGIVRQDG